MKNPTGFDLPRLQQFAPQLHVKVGTLDSEASFAGALLWDVLIRPPVGGILTNPKVKNDILRKVVVVTGTDCHQTVFSAGELDPSFGGSPIMVAYAGGGQLLGEDGFARIVGEASTPLTGSAKAGVEGRRSVASIASIVVADAAMPLIGLGGAPRHAACPGGPSKFFTVSGQVKNPTRFDLRKLQQFDPTAHLMSGPAFHLSFTGGKLQWTPQANGPVVSFTGAPLWDLLNKPPVGGILANPKVKDDILRKVVVVIGTDCSQTVFSAGELVLGREPVVAYAAGDQPLDKDGFARIVLSGETGSSVLAGDETRGRSVSNISSIVVGDAASEQDLNLAAAPASGRSRPGTKAADAESGVTGVWTANDVGFPPWTLTLKADGDKLSGTVQQGARDSSGYSTTLTMPVAIYDGEINGNKINFKCQDPGHDRTITFTGIVNGDEIIVTRTVVVRPAGNPGRNGIFGASGAARFIAQRVVSTGAASAPTKPDQGPTAGFNCAGNLTNVEHVVCSDPTLSKLDDELAVAYQQALRDQPRPDIVRRSQRQWVEERDRCKSPACISAAYRKRLGELESQSVKPQNLGELRFVSIDISGVANSELDWARPPRGHVKFDDVPFTILSGDRAVVHMHNRVRPDYPRTFRLPIGLASVAWVHLLLSGDWISEPGQQVGTVRISYSDGSSRDVPLISLEDIRETWMPNFSLSGHPVSRPPEGVTWNAAYSESQMRAGMASTAFLDRLSIRTDPARKVSEISFLTNEPQTGMILTAITLEIASLQPGAGTTPLGRDSRRLDAR